MKIGALKPLEKLENLRNSLVRRTEEFVSLMKEFEDRVETFHRSALVLSFDLSDFPVIHAVSPDGVSLTAEVLTDPFTITPTPFKFRIGIDDFKLKRAGIMEFPPKTRFLAVLGDDPWIEKIAIFERVKGVEYLTFAFRVDDELYSKLERIRSARIENAILSLDDEGLNVVITIPEGLPQGRVQLLAEMGKVLREELGLKPAKFSKIPKNTRALITFMVDFDEVMEEDPLVRISDFLRRLENGFDMFLKGAGLV